MFNKNSFGGSLLGVNPNKASSIGLIAAILLYINPMPKIKIPLEPIEKTLLKKMQYETLLINIRYLELYRRVEIQNIS